MIFVKMRFSENHRISNCKRNKLQNLVSPETKFSPWLRRRHDSMQSRLLKDWHRQWMETGISNSAASPWEQLFPQITLFRSPWNFQRHYTLRRTKFARSENEKQHHETFHQITAVSGFLQNCHSCTGRGQIASKWLISDQHLLELLINWVSLRKISVILPHRDKGNAQLTEQDCRQQQI